MLILRESQNLNESDSIQGTYLCLGSTPPKGMAAMDRVTFVVNENDALPLEYKLQESRPRRHLDVNDVINNPAPFCIVCADERGFQEQLGGMGGTGGGDGSDGTGQLGLGPLLVALLKKVPSPEKGWPASNRVRWFRTFAMNVSQIYDAETEPVEMKIELEKAPKVEDDL